MLVDENLICGFKILIPKINNISTDKKLIRNMTPPPKNRNVKKDEEEEDEKNQINNRILDENTNSNK